MNSFYFYKRLDNWDCDCGILESMIMDPIGFLAEVVETKSLERFLGGFGLFCINKQRTARELLSSRVKGKSLVRGQYKGKEAVILLSKEKSEYDVFIKIPYSIDSREDLEMLLYCRSFAYPEEKYFSRVPIEDIDPIREYLWIEKTNFSEILMDRYYDKESFSVKIENNKDYFVVEG